MKVPSIIVVDDDASAEQYLSLTLWKNRYHVRAARNGVEALLQIETAVPDLVICDLRMPVMDGLEFLDHVKQRWPDLPVIILTVNQDIPTVVKAVQMGAINYLVKPASQAAMLSSVHRALRKLPFPQPGSEIPEIIGVSKYMVEARHLVALTARSDVNVVITGRTGTGKELVAHAIHRCSSLSDAPFIAHNCAAIPPDLFESQFFGHCRGASTGADADQVGLLAQADGGILFLDELESLNPPHQAKLLRVLDDGEVRPVGSRDVRQVSVRFLAASNQNPMEAVAAGSLREDLYYRLRGFEIHLSPLSERPEDIPLLVAHFMAGAGGDITSEALGVLESFHWPGNVRELLNVLRSAHATAAGGRITLQHLALGPGARGAYPLETSEASGQTLEELETHAVLRALKQHGGNRSRAASALGIDRSTLSRRMKKARLKALD